MKERNRVNKLWVGIVNYQKPNAMISVKNRTGFWGIILLLLHLTNPSFSQSRVGVMDINISGVPKGYEAKVRISGPQGFTRTISTSERLNNLANGSYKIAGEIIILREKPFSKAFRPAERSVNINNDTISVGIVYRQMPGSDRIWFGNQNAPANQNLNIIAYTDESIRVSSGQTPSNRLTGKVTSIRSLAFDAEGNLWAADAGTIKMYAWNTLGGNSVSPVYTLSHEAACLAFDAEGNLWFSDGKKASRIMRIPRSMLYSSGGNKTDVVLSGASFDGTQGLAFDHKGNLWAANYGKHDIVMIPAGMLVSSSADMNGLISITCESKPPVINILRSPKGMAFDRGGNLWVGYFGPNVIAKIPAGSLTSTAKITPEIQITLSVGVLLHQVAFDEEGSLWTSLSAGSFGKLTQEQLREGGKKTPAVIITGDEFRYGSGLAIYPSPEGFPLVISK